jgi:hypothetical protein
MPQTDELRSLLEKANSTTERIVQRLLRSPWDLVDARYLMRLFQASAADFQQALARLQERAEQPSS